MPYPHTAPISTMIPTVELSVNCYRGSTRADVSPKANPAPKTKRAAPHGPRSAGLGKLIGKRTWGGLEGRSGPPQLMDGVVVTAPSSAVWDASESHWIAENKGTSPDIEVENHPQLIRQGDDLQLERAIEQILEELDKNPAQKLSRPQSSKYHTLR